MRGSFGSILAIGLLATLIAAAAWYIFPMKPGTLEATGTLDTCFTGEPVLTLDGDWRSALPAYARANGLTYVPIATVLSGLTYDQTSGELRSNGEVVAHQGDRVRVTGTVVEVHGDPSPCYYIFGLRLGELRAEAE